MVMMRSRKREEDIDPLMEQIFAHLDAIVLGKAVLIVPYKNSGKTAVQKEIKEFFEAQGKSLEDFK